MKLGRLPFLLLAAACLASGIATGLARLGVALPGGLGRESQLHGVLMVSGFFGTLIGLERAVAHGARWTFAAPLSAGIAGLAAAFGRPDIGGVLATLAAALFLIVNVALARRQLADFTLVTLVAALSWFAGALSWALGRAPSASTPWLLSFLVLTIFAERRELGRVLSPGPWAGRAFWLATALVAAGTAAAAFGAGRVLLAAGLGAVTLWLARWDVARRTVRRRGLTRFMAVALLAAYVWLGVGAVALVGAGADAAGARYDAFVHAVALGFVFSMVFAHAPVIFPAVLGTPVEYSPVFYAHVTLLGVTLFGRVAGDLVGSPALRIAGAVGNGAAIVLFFALTLRGVVRGRRKKRES
jgi:hypothetical protein